MRLDELAKMYGVYDRNEKIATRINRMAVLPDSQDIAFNKMLISHME